MKLLYFLRVIIAGTLRFIYDHTRFRVFSLSILNIILICTDIIDHKIGMTIATIIIGMCADQTLEYFAYKKVTKDTTELQIQKMVNQCYEKQMIYWIDHLYPNDKFIKFQQEFIYLVLELAKKEAIKKAEKESK